MSDIFTLKTIRFNSELGMAFKNFRIEKEVIASAITTQFDKASSYISKLEKGDIKKIDSSFLIKLCNYITKSENGLMDFIKRLSSNYLDYSLETKLSIMNMDDLLIEHKLPLSLIDEIERYLKKHNISRTALTKKINANDGITNISGFTSAQTNIWCSPNDNTDESFIKLDIPQSYIEDLLDRKYSTVHSVIMEAILYSMYRLGSHEESEARDLANSKLRINNIFHIRGGNIVRINNNVLEDLFGGLEPDVAEALKNVSFGLKLITTLSEKHNNKSIGAKRIKQIDENMKEDLGFYFAYMSFDLVALEKKKKEKKKAFLSELKELIQKYSLDSDGIDFYNID